VKELAHRTGTDARYPREWLSAQPASGYVEYDAKIGLFSLNEEQAFALAEEGSPAFIPGAFQIAVAQFKASRLSPSADDKLRPKTLDIGSGEKANFRPSEAAN
jgi:hypothetical protein